MPDDAEILKRARKYDRSAVESLLANYYPIVHRLAYALTGREDVGRGVVRFVFNQSLKVLPKWDRDRSPHRWFTHHTVLTTRRADRYEPEPMKDVLVKPFGKPPADYIASIRALRALPQQQREAFLISQGEGFDLRGLAVAMDCSTEAAANHLKAATDSLRTISGPHFDQFVANAKSAYAQLSPKEDLTAPSVKKYARKLIWPKRIKRAVTLLIILSALAATLWLLKTLNLLPFHF